MFLTIVWLLDSALLVGVVLWTHFNTPLWFLVQYISVGAAAIVYGGFSANYIFEEDA